MQKKKKQEEEESARLARQMVLTPVIAKTPAQTLMKFFKKEPEVTAKLETEICDKQLETLKESLCQLELKYWPSIETEHDLVRK